MGMAMLPEQVAMASPIGSSFFLSVKAYSPPGPSANEDSFILPAKAYSPPGTSSNEDQFILPAKAYCSSSNKDSFILPAKAYSPPGLSSNEDQFILPAKAYCPSTNEDQCILPAKAYCPSTNDDSFILSSKASSPRVSSSDSSLFCLPAKTYSPAPPMKDNGPFMSRAVGASQPIIKDEDIEMDQAPGLDADFDMEEAPPLDEDIDMEQAPAHNNKDSIKYPYYAGYEFCEHISLIEPVTVPRMSQIPAHFDDTSPNAMDCTEIPASISKAYPNDMIVPSLVPARLSISIKRVPEHQAEVISPEPKRRCSQRVSVEPSSDMHSLTHTPSSLFRHRISAFLDEFYDSKHSIQATESLVSPQPPTIANRKNLFGPGGLFSNDPPIKGPEILQDAPSASKETLFRGLGKKIKQQITDIYPSKSFTNTPTGKLKNRVQVSLDPDTQAKLFSQLEMMICTTANNFLLRQYYEGHVSQHSINKVSHQWHSKNRPHVNQFCFDQGTQRDLIMENRRTIIFPVGFVNNSVMFHTIMRNWKAIAMEMRARTFCLPDTAIRKILYEIHGILEMLEAPLPTFQKLNETIACAQLKMVKASEMKRSHTRNRLSR
ncbi:hypothetical protein N7493_000127 [Penicillium malachiteum]|uniref:Uncharacterized protein n=1 Tax=Penicillium malachiteum TaxID=1324776 RepID=A0AAD6HVX2_9EURO|nr:hypothetical protein N7493_000127 [Penicillium malachiteum]